MSVYVGGFVPGFQFKLNTTEISPFIITEGSTDIVTGQYIDTNKTITTYTNALLGSQYNIQVVPEQFSIFGQTPSVSIISSDSGIATINHLNNTIFISTGQFDVIGYYEANSYYSEKQVTLHLNNTSGGGSPQIATNYIADAVDPSKHVLIIYNSGSTNSTNLKTYYTGRRPTFSSANILGIACPNSEVISYNTFITGIRNPIISYITGVSGEKPIRYVVMLMDIPTRVSDTITYSVPHQLSTSFQQLNLRNGDDYNNRDAHFSLGQFERTTCLVSYINFGTYNDCTNYIDKITLNQTGVYLTGNGNNTGYYIEDTTSLVTDFTFYPVNYASGRFLRTVLNEFPNIEYVYSSVSGNFITTGNNLAGFFTWGANGGRFTGYANNGSIKWGGNDNWYIMTSMESFNGQRNNPTQGSFIKWFSSGAFGGTGYENCPVGAVANVEEPYDLGPKTGFYLLWERGWPLIECAWQSKFTPYFLCVGDPLIVKTV